MLFLDACEELSPLIGFVKAALGIIQIVIPIALIIIGTVDLGKAVIASDEKKIKESQMTLIKRAMMAVLVFLLATIVTFLMGVVGSKEWRRCWTGAQDCPYGVDPIDGGCKAAE